MKLLAAATAALVMCATPVVQQTTTPVSLKTTAKESGPGNTVTITLASGKQITVAAEDIDEAGTTLLITKAKADADARVVLIPTPDAARPQIRAICRGQVACETQQTAAVRELFRRPMARSVDLRAIRNKCSAEFPSDFVRENDCEMKGAPNILIPTEAPTPNPDRITMAHFSGMDTGTTYEAVVRFIGRAGTELSRSEIAGNVSVMYRWSNPDGTGMNALFRNGILVSKSQFGLR